MPSYYPIMLDVRNKPALVIGGNAVAAEKAAALHASGAKVTVQSPDFCAELQAMAQSGTITLRTKTYEARDLEGAFIIVAAATYEPELAEAIWIDGQKNGQLVNIVDVPAHCNFIVPSILRRGSLTIAVSTEGASPSLAKRIRQHLESLFPSSYEGYMRLAAIARQYMREAGLSYEQRDQFFGDFFASDILDKLTQHDEIEALASTVRLLHRYNVETTVATIMQDIKEAERKTS
jgi:precorrin-2 dehydrogenase/sirohydrochlorin ferrochelatase